ncbi:MAG: PAS domain S-box protein, partial [Chloroflexi bacterium]|nr:PAS domain S-box protein [Chloroflexota bacterium]
THLPPNDAVLGTLLLPQDALFIAARSILTSQATGPARGTLILGRYLDVSEQTRLARLMQLSFRLRRVDDVATAPQFGTLTRTRAARTPEIEVVNDDQLIGRAWLPDVNGDPAVVLELEIPRTLLKHGQMTLAYFIGTLAILGLLSSGVTLILLDRWSLARQRQQTSEARYRSLFQYSPVVLMEQDFSAVKQRLLELRAQGVQDFEAYLAARPQVVTDCLPLIRITDVNDAAVQLYGAHDRAELLTTLDQILPPDAHQLFCAELSSMAAGHTHFDGEGINQMLDGRRLHVRLHWLAAPGSEATFSKVFVVVEDITAHRAAEAALRLSEERYRLITENVSDTVWLMDLSMKITFVSPSVTARRGFTLEEMQAMSFEQHMTPASLAVALPVLAETLTPERLADTTQTLSRTLELEYYRKDGSTFWSEATFTLIRDEHGAPAGLLGVGRDITQRKQRERELEALLSVAASLRAAPSRGDLLPVIVNQVMRLLRMDSAALVLRKSTSSECVVVMARGAWEDWTGQRLACDHSLTGQVMATGRPYLNNDIHAASLFAMTDQLNGIRAAACSPLSTQEAVIGALWIGRKSDIHDGELKLLVGMTEMAANALYRVGLVETLEQRVADRTRELSEANQRLQELDRAKDQFISNVNHELRTPLANIKLYLGLLERGKPEKHSEYLQTLRREQSRLEKMIEDLLDLSRLDLGVTRIEPVPTPLDPLLRQLVADRVNLAIERGLTLDYQAAEDLPLVFIDPERLTEVVTNLVTNAINYTPHGGSVLVLANAADNDRWVTFTVRDTGPGISARDLPRLFERFYRGEVGRRASAPGTGLGLAISKEIVDRLGGHITVDSVPGEGAVFTVWLRRAEQ